MIYTFFDFGSTFVKYCKYDSNKNECLDVHKIEFPSAISSDNGSYEVDLQAINHIIEKLASRATEDNCAKIFISVQMHGFILRQNNNFSNYISWRDTTGNIYDHDFEDVDWDLRGTSKKKNLPILKMKKKAISQCEFFTLGSYIAYKLCGQNCTHITDAAASGFYNGDTAKREDTIFHNICLPQATMEFKKIGYYENIEIFTPVGDHQISFYGSYADTDAYFLNIGTASQISVIAESGKNYNGCEARPYFSKGVRLYTKSALPGGKELYNGIDDRTLYNAYKAALSELPEKNMIIVGGGACEYHRETIESALASLGLNYTFINNHVAMKGLIRMITENELKIGTMLSEIAFTNFPIFIKNSGLDFFILDNEHGAFDYSDIASLSTKSHLVDSKMIVRLSDNTRMNITKFCDMGVTGFLLPMTNTADDIKKVVEYAMYSPTGKRGISLTRAHTLYNPPKLAEYMCSANMNMSIYAQIETMAGVNNVDDILDVEGVSGIIIGPNDLSCDMDCIGRKEPVKECIRRLAEACKSKNKSCGIITTDKELIKFAIEAGVTMISYGSELNMIADSCKRIKEINYENI